MEDNHDRNADRQTNRLTDEQLAQREANNLFTGTDH